MNSGGQRAPVGLLAAALGVRLGAAGVRHRVDYGRYDGADVHEYHRDAVALLTSERPLDGEPLIGTRFVKHLTAAVYRMIGPSRIGGSLVFALAGFAGSALFRQAFAVGAPGGDRHAYARLVLFAPSLAYWPSSVGKDALMQLSLGAASLGTARAATERSPRRGLAIAGAGGALGALVRPHVAAASAVASTVGLAVAGRRGAALTMAGQAAALGLLARRDLRRYGFDVPGAAVSHAAGRTGGGGSGFEPRSSVGPAAAFGVLFRPHPLEAHNAPSAAAALEGMLLLALTARNAGALGRLVRGRADRAYAAYALTCTLMLVAAFSGIANRGLLARQRAQVLPFYLVLVAGPGRRS